MSGEPSTRKVEEQELARALAPFVDPPTKLGLGVPREFRRVVEARPSPPLPVRGPVTRQRPIVPPASKNVSPAVMPAPLVAPRKPRLSLPASYKWMAALALGGFAFGGLVAATLHATSVTARVSTATPRVPPALPEPASAAVAAKPVVRGWEPASNVRRVAVDALLTGRTRAALEHYRRVLASTVSVSEREAIARVVHLLERELHSCEEQAGTPCGF